MQFDTILQKYLDAMPDCQNIFLMGMDGLAVAKVSRDNDSALAFEVFAAEYTNLLQSLNRTMHQLDASTIREHMHITEDTFVLSYFVTPQYYLLLTVRSASLLGHARFQLRKMAVDLAAELALL